MEMIEYNYDIRKVERGARLRRLLDVVEQLLSFGEREARSVAVLLLDLRSAETAEAEKRCVALTAFQR